MVKPGKKNKTFSSSLMYAMVAMSIAFATNASAATLTFTGAAGTTNFHDANNWDSRTVPTSADQVNINSGSTVVLSSSAKVGSVQVSNGGIFNIQNALEFISGVNIAQGGILNVLQGTVETKTAPSSFANLTTYPTITVGGKFHISNGTVSGASTTTNKPTVIVKVPTTGSLHFSGANNKLLFADTSIDGELIWSKLDEGSTTETSAQDLTLHFSQIIANNPNAKVKLYGSSLLRLSNSDEFSTIKGTNGEIIISGNQIQGDTVVQSIDLPIIIEQSSRLFALASTERSNFIRLGGGVSIDGELHVKDNAQFVLSKGLNTISSTSQTTITDGAAVYIEGGETSWLGTINANAQSSGSFVIQAPIEVANAINVNELFVLGGKLSLGSNSLATVHNPSVIVGKQVFIDSGSIIGTGEGAKRELQLLPGAIITVDGADSGDTIQTVSKLLDNITIRIGSGSSMSVAKGAALGITNNTIIQVQSDGILTLHEGSRIVQNGAGTNVPVSEIILEKDGTLALTVGARPVTIDTNIRGAEGKLAIISTSKEKVDDISNQVTFKSKILEPQSLLIAEDTYSAVVFDCSASANDVSNGVVIPRKFDGKNTDVSIVGCVAATVDGTEWDIGSLILDTAGLLTSQFTSTSSTSNSSLQPYINVKKTTQIGLNEAQRGILAGPGTVTSDRVDIISGYIANEELSIGQGGLYVKSDALKEINAVNVKIAPKSTVHVETGAKYTVNNDNALWHFAKESKLIVEAGSHIASSKNSLDPIIIGLAETDPASIRPQFWLENADMIFGDVTAVNPTLAQVDIFIRSSGSKITTSEGSQSKLTGGIIAEDGYGNPPSDASILLGKDSTITLGSNTGAPVRPGTVIGPDAHVRLGKGPFDLSKPISVRTITIEEGAKGTIAQGVCDATTGSNSNIDGTNSGNGSDNTSGNGSTIITPGDGSSNSNTGTEIPNANGENASPFSSEVCEGKKEWLGTDPVTSSWAFFGLSIGLFLVSCGLGGFIVYQYIDKKKEKEDEGEITISGD